MFKHISDFLRQEDHIFLKNLLIFAAIFFVVFVISFGTLSVLGFIPTEFQEETDDATIASKLQNSTFSALGLTETHSSTTGVSASSQQGEYPYRLVADSIALDTVVVRPQTSNYVELDNALAKGAVYYPGSGLAGKGNMFVFGHSTSYAYVNNKAYQVFNNIKNLKEGDEIEVYGKDKIYYYKVREVKLVNASKELVEFSNNRNMLTLSTCNSFGQKSDRYVAEADYVRSSSM